MVDLRLSQPTQVGQIARPDTSTASVATRAAGQLAETVGRAVDRSNEVDQQILDDQARIAKQAQDEEDQRLALAQAAAMAQLSEREQLRAAELKGHVGPGAEGFEEQLSRERGEWLREFDAGFGTNDRVRQRFQEQVASYSGRATVSSRLYVMGQQAQKAGNDFETARDTWINTIMREPTPAKVNEVIGQARTMIDAMPSLNAEQRQQLEREMMTRAYKAMADGMIAGGADQAVSAAIGQGVFNEVMTPEQLANLQSQADVAERARALAAERAAADAQRATVEKANALRLRVDAGELPNAAEIDQMVAEARAAGLGQDDIVKIELMREDVVQNRAFASATPEQLERFRADLSSRPITSLSPAEQRMLNRLPGMIEARRSTAVDPLRETFRSGPDGRVEVGRQLAAIPDRDERFRRAEALEAGFGYTAMLDPIWQAYVLDGGRTVDANPDYAPPETVRRAFRQMVGDNPSNDALRMFNGDAQAAIRDNARNIYVQMGGRFDQRGGPSSPTVWTTAINASLGGRRKPDGSWEGGIATWNGRRFVLPTDMTAARFGQVLRGVSFANARYADGSTPTPAQVLNNFTPVYAGQDDEGGDLYQFASIIDGRMLYDASNTPFELRLR